MAVITAAAIGAGAGILGDVMSQSSAQATNEQNMAIAQMNNQFNAQQAQLNRDFQASQSDTQMQRRVEDLRLAGLNPALAYQQGGAQAMSGSTAQSAGLPSLQNPGAAFNQLGNQVTSALQLSSQNAQIEALKAQAQANSAQAAKTDAERTEVLPENVKLLQAQQGLTARQAQQAYAQADFIYKNIVNTDADTALKNVQTALAGVNYDVLRGTAQSLISAAQSDATAKQLGLAGMRNLSDVQQGVFGRVLAYINAALQPLATAAGAASDLMPGTSITKNIILGGRRP